ncbi:MAG: hypothetical protein KZQ74_12000, partial [gamma proteobacterium symbiont of Bathyaustriella thionipta]|nr:hypothetical protein [gamma proteobacterium symbiont of Bathyaustriella thionipta]
DARKQKKRQNIVNRQSVPAEKESNFAELSLISKGKSNKSSLNINGSSQAEILNEELLTVNEATASHQTEYQELTARVKELEALVQAKISLIELKDKSLAILQKQQQLKRIKSNSESKVYEDALANDVNNTKEIASATQLLNNQKVMTTGAIPENDVEQLQ